MVGEKDLNRVEAFQTLSFAQEIHFGPGSLGRLKEAVERSGWGRVMLCTSRSLVANGHSQAVENTLKDCLVAVYDQVLPHVQDTQVEEAVALAKTMQVQAVIGLGGGSPIGMAKAVSHALEAQQAVPSPTAQPAVPVIAIPTTYAGSEMTGVYGVTRTQESPPRKVTVSDPRIAPRLVIYDPQLTLDLPPELTGSTGINALGHCIEALYSVTRNPLSTAAALDGLRRIGRALPRCFANGADLDARSEMLLGAHLAGFSLASVKMALHHGLCHVLGGTFNVPHGIANSIVLPYAVRFNAQAAAPQLILAAEGLNIPVQGRPAPEVIEDLVDRIFDLTGQMHLPQRLRDASIQETDLPRIARLAAENRTVQNNPRPVNGPGEIEDLLKDAW
jgi:maleylacetate reductase